LLAEWQVVQVAETGIWPLDGLLADVPLWQLAQSVDELNKVWLTLVPVQLAVDLWQASQAALVVMWLVERAVADVVPVWQLAQPVVTVTFMWNLAGNQLG
jgi:hypothetical protein